ncbi:MAG: type II secretion system GspH family protein [Puniceicoccales bacterium]|jgi:type II secretory pathway pseudopilin PulG|nr:type II secretion system GspH family protein [Puniceicoccales bacterium]
MAKKLQAFFTQSLWRRKFFRRTEMMKIRHHPCLAFTAIEIMCTVTILCLIAAGVLKIYGTYQERDKLIRTRLEMSALVDMLETYRQQHGDYPKIESHDDHQGGILNQALHWRIDPNGNALSDEKRIDFLTTNLKEIDGKFVDPFLSDYIYYYKRRTQEDLWKNPSYFLISKGPKGQQNSKRNVATATKSVTISDQGQITGNLRDDIIATEGGFL